MYSNQNIEKAIKTAKNIKIRELNEKISELTRRIKNINNMSECSIKKIIKLSMEIRNLEFEKENLNKMNINNISQIIKEVKGNENNAFKQILNHERKNRNFVASLLK